jgi:hypothetical protein
VNKTAREYMQVDGRGKHDSITALSNNNNNNNNNEKNRINTAKFPSQSNT